MMIVDSFKQASQKAENFAQKKQLRASVIITAETLLSNHPHSQINTWANKILTVLSKEISRA